MQEFLEEYGVNYENRDIKDGCPSPALVIKGATVPFSNHRSLILEAKQKAQNRMSKKP